MSLIGDNYIIDCMTTNKFNDAAFNLINEVDVEETDRRMAAYQRENAEQIDLQSSYEDKAAEMLRLREGEERKERAQRAADFARQDEVDRAEREKEEKELIKALESGEGSADKILKKQRLVALKRSSARQAMEASNPNTSNSKPSLLSKYAAFNKSAFSQAEKDPFEPEDPLADYDENWYDYRDLSDLPEYQNAYRDEGTQEALLDGKKLTGGFDVRVSVWERAVRSSVMGLWTKPLADGDGDVVMASASQKV